MGPEAFPIEAPSRAVRARRAAAALLGARPEAQHRVSPFGDPRIDDCLPGGGLGLGRWHEIGSGGVEAEIPSAGAGFVAGLASRAAGRGLIFWVVRRADLYPPGLQMFGLPLDRTIFVRARDDNDALAVLEDVLRTRGVGAAVGEVSSPGLIAGKRLQLACEREGGTGFVLRRDLFRAGAFQGGTAAATRWSVSPLPSHSTLPGLPGPSRWRVALERCRGGRTGAWIVEAVDAASNVRVDRKLADHPSAPLSPPKFPRIGDSQHDGEHATRGGRRYGRVV